MFEKNVATMVRELREQNGKENLYIGKCLMEIKDELFNTNLNIKTNAFLKT